MNLVLLGPPGSGKGTQAKLLVQRFGLKPIVMGDELRKYKKKLGIEKILSKGELITDEIIFKVLECSISSQRDKLLIDGVPRNIQQAKHLDKVVDIDWAILLNIKDINVLVGRIEGRMICPECSADYHSTFKKPAKDNMCDICKHGLIRRSDDSREVLKRRVEVYNDNIEDILEYYSKTKRLHEVNADQDLERVYSDVVEVLA